MEEKKELAQIAVRYVTEGMSVALDPSTTNTEIAKALKTKFDRLTIITNSLPIVNELVSMPGYTVIMTGGVIRHEELSIIGDLTEEFTARFHADLFFMSMSGVTLEAGITDNAIGEVQVKKSCTLTPSVPSPSQTAASSDKTRLSKYAGQAKSSGL